MIKSIDFFKGIQVTRANKMIKQLTDGTNFSATDYEVEKIIKNSTRIFKDWSIEDCDEFEEYSESNRIILHWVAGVNTQEFLKIE